MKIRRRQHPINIVPGSRKDSKGNPIPGNLSGNRGVRDPLYSHAGEVLSREPSPPNPNKPPHIVGHVW